MAKFVKGQVANPKGRPPGSRHKLQEDFVRDFCAVWETHGFDALLKVAADEPAKFVQVAAGILPKEIRAEIEHRAIVRVPMVAETIEEWLKPSLGSQDRSRNLNS